MQSGSGQPQEDVVGKNKKKTNNSFGAMVGERYRIALMGGSVGKTSKSSSATNKVVLQVTEEGGRKNVGKFEWSSYELNNVQVCSLPSYLH